MAIPVEYVEPQVLACWMRTPQQAGNIIVIDVRDDDFIGGNIRGAVNVQSDAFRDDSCIDELIDGALQGKPKVVLHCMFSQQRGPRAALRLAGRLEARGLNEPSVYVLRGGFATFARQYKHEADLVEQYDASVWQKMT